MRRREFIAGLGSAAAAVSSINWPLAAHSQRGDRVRRVGVLVFGENNAARVANIAEFRAALQKLNWVEGRNLRIELAFVTDENRLGPSAQEMAGVAPDVIVTTSLPATRAAQRSTRIIPIVFVSGGDPNNNGLVNSITHPEGNVTGFASFFSTSAGKWVELLKEAAPSVSKVAMLFNPELATHSNVTHYIASIEAAAAALGIKTRRTPVRDATEIALAISGFAAEPNGGLIVLPPPFPLSDRALIYGLAVASQHRGRFEYDRCRCRD
jgi:putative tryptophan/tyrosine transport system substrate-binding protein